MRLKRGGDRIDHCYQPLTNHYDFNVCTVLEDRSVVALD
jgi:hypothetical protein